MQAHFESDMWIMKNGLDLSVSDEQTGNDIPGLDADVYFGDPSVPLPNWREVLPEEDDDSDDVSDEERDAVERMIGFGSDGTDDDTDDLMPKIRPSPFNKYGKDLSTAPNAPKVDLHGKPCGVGQNTARDGCVAYDGQSQQQPQQSTDNAAQTKPGSNFSAQFDPSKVKETDKPSEEDVLGTPKKEAEDPAQEWKTKKTQSKFFKSWFGDWENDPDNSSKVVDPKTGEPKETGPIRGDSASKVMKEGKPIMVYHGTPNEKFDEFRRDKIHNPEAQLYGPGFYFTESMEVADTYREKERPYKFTKPKEEVLYFIEKAIRGTLIGIAPSQHLQSYIETLRNSVNENPDPATALNAYVQWLNGQHDVEMDMSSIMKPVGEGTRFNVYLNIRKPFDADTGSLKYDELTDEMRENMKVIRLGRSEKELEEYQTKLDKSIVKLKKAKKDPYPDDDEIETWEKRVKKYTRLVRDSQIQFDFNMTNLKKRTYAYADLNELAGIKKQTINDHLVRLGYDGITHIGGYAIGKGDRPHRVWIAFEGNQVKSSDNQGTFDPNTNDMNKALPRTKKEPKPKVDITGKPCGRGQNKKRDHCIPKVKPTPLAKRPKVGNVKPKLKPTKKETSDKKPIPKKEPTVKKPVAQKVTKPKKLTVAEANTLARSFYDKFTKSKSGSNEEKLQLDGLRDTLSKTTNAAIEFMGHNIFRVNPHGKKAVMVDQIINRLQSAKKAKKKGPPKYNMDNIVPKLKKPFHSTKEVVEYLASMEHKKTHIEQIKAKVEKLVKGAKELFNTKHGMEKDQRLQMYEQKVKFITQVSKEFSKKVRDRLVEGLIVHSWNPPATDVNNFKNQMTELFKHRKNFDIAKVMTKFGPALEFINKAIRRSVNNDFKIISTPDGRGFYRSVSKNNPKAAVAIDEYFTEDHTMIHEIGHHLEYVIPGLQKAAIEFVKKRTANSPNKKLKEVFPKAGYGDTEIGNQDDFEKTFGKSGSWYVGKIYPASPSLGKMIPSTEVISMGLEQLYKDPAGFAKSDPEYCALIVNALRGSVV